MISDELMEEIIEQRQDEYSCPKCGYYPLYSRDEYMEDTGYTLDILFCVDCDWEQGDDPKIGFTMDCRDCHGSGVINDPYRTTGESVIDCYTCKGSGKLEN